MISQVSSRPNWYWTQAFFFSKIAIILVIWKPCDREFAFHLSVFRGVCHNIKEYLIFDLQELFSKTSISAFFLSANSLIFGPYAAHHIMALYKCPVYVHLYQNESWVPHNTNGPFKFSCCVPPFACLQLLLPMSFYLIFCFKVVLHP